MIRILTEKGRRAFYTHLAQAIRRYANAHISILNRQHKILNMADSVYFSISHIGWRMDFFLLAAAATCRFRPDYAVCYAVRFAKITRVCSASTNAWHILSRMKPIELGSHV